ncbi:hypothetical protein, partial [Rhodoplanes sp. SY1]|uniref:hypothetical protein n=1 Tax=Rhodoplanes sp. SY1 TaxID=3166646 RepID=UPI0038B67DFE
ILLHRIAKASGFAGQLIVNPPIRIKSGSFLNDPIYRKKNILLASAKAATQNGLVLILLDCEDDCPGEVGPKILQDAKSIRSDINMLVALAQKEYESWFLAAATSLRGLVGLPEDLEAPRNSEAIRGAKEWLRSRMSVTYDPIIHQAMFSRAMDLEQAKINSSFKRLCEKIGRFLSAQANPGSP